MSGAGARRILCGNETKGERRCTAGPCRLPCPPPRAARLDAGIGTIPPHAAQGAVPGGGTPEQMARFLESEIAKWAKVIRDGNIRPD